MLQDSHQLHLEIVWRGFIYYLYRRKNSKEDIRVLRAAGFGDDEEAGGDGGGCVCETGGYL